MRRQLIASLLAATLTTPGTIHAAASTERARAVHVLNRIAYGPAPGEVERVLSIGVDRYIAEQLAPERIGDREVESRIARYETLQLSERELVESFVKAQEERRKRNSEENASPSRSEMAQRLRVPLELTSARLERAISSKKQLNEVMADFWLNHFNVFAGKGLDRVLIVSYERDTIRPHMWGRFEELLMATAKSPAMLFYLDNARSIAPPEARSGNSRRMQMREGGLNENYARELLELHTLGVDGGYTQKDVTELARLLTGWSIPRPREGRSGFVFRAALHDRGAKTILGQHFPAGGGIEEGERMIRYLATHPSTAKHIARKLVQKFVSDEPPAALVDRVAARFLATRGDLRETVRAVLTSREFSDPRYFDAKVKTPFEYVVSAVRATGASTTDLRSLARALRDLGQPLYFSQPPTGYGETSEEWVSSGALVNRLNFAIALAGSQLPGVRFPPMKANSVAELSLRLTGKTLSQNTATTIEAKVRELSDPDKRVQLASALILGSPEFQKQ